MSDTVPSPDQPVISRRLAAEAIVNYFLANADAGNHAANDELVAELARRQREARQHNDCR
ncbi:MAG TPA: hypothetical protein VFO16_05665 [Pseudonocardiaceae bacterium]|nr:hypothetical protein [Pseudonocardiaceae bacterium]